MLKESAVRQEILGNKFTGSQLYYRDGLHVLAYNLYSGKPADETAVFFDYEIASQAWDKINKLLTDALGGGGFEIALIRVPDEMLEIPMPDKSNLSMWLSWADYAALWSWLKADYWLDTEWVKSHGCSYLKSSFLIPEH